MARGFLHVSPVEVTPSTAGLALLYPEPGELGADRIANSVAAVARGSLPAIVADFGTATTFDVIDAGGSYLGGAIAPGVGTAAAEMFRKAEKLSPVDLEAPGSPLGRSTEEAVRSGVLHGAAGAADRLIDLLSERCGGSPALLATGGWAAGLAPFCRSRFTVVPDLTLAGIDEIGRRNEGRQ
jgi:type III pantothenate kinase